MINARLWLFWSVFKCTVGIWKQNDLNPDLRSQWTISVPKYNKNLLCMSSFSFSFVLLWWQPLRMDTWTLSKSSLTSSGSLTFRIKIPDPSAFQMVKENSFLMCREASQKPYKNTDIRHHLKTGLKVPENWTNSPDFGHHRKSELFCLV